MPVKPPSLAMPRCAAPKLKQHDAKTRYEAHRESSTKRGYNARWRKARLTFLAREPLCWMCMTRGIVKGAVLVDHWFPHRGDSKVFWDTKHWAPLCESCHNGPKQALEYRGQKALEAGWGKITAARDRMAGGGSDLLQLHR